VFYEEEEFMIPLERYHQTVAYIVEAQFEVFPRVYYERREIGAFCSRDLAEKVLDATRNHFRPLSSCLREAFELKDSTIEEVILLSLDKPEQVLLEDSWLAVKARFAALTQEFTGPSGNVPKESATTPKCDDQIALEKTYGFSPKSFATQKSLRRAYRAWCLKNHPDKKPRTERAVATLRFQTALNHYERMMERLEQT
jgi:hypothetical protein